MNELDAISILQNEHRCVIRANSCNRDCGNCELVRKDTEILEAYDMAIDALVNQLYRRNLYAKR